MIFCMLCLVAGCAIAVLDVDSRTGEQRVCYPANSRDEHKQPVSAVESVRDDWLSVCKKKKKREFAQQKAVRRLFFTQLEKCYHI